ncbi:MAG: 16S rRNA (guanine(527)-N(7))-methyltransferase RsmG [Ureaplasma sp.]|nr:16S rRNA (guanine(527)-N(7))-methyltransferase RsmG [Ureaplasma sp.]
MTKDEFIDYLKLNLNLSDDKLDLIFKYKDFLQSQNKISNLTRLDSEKLVYSSYFLESLMPFINMNFKPVQNQSLLDIGTGSGIPGVLLKIVYPELNVTLIESNSKKINFLSKLIELLKLENISIIQGRSEEIIRNQDLYEKFDFVTSRAVSSLHNILELSAGYCKVNGLIIEPKSIKSEIELLNANSIINNLDLQLVNNIKYEFNDKQNNVLIFKKQKETNRKYPRTWAQILKDENINSH